MINLHGLIDSGTFERGSMTQIGRNSCVAAWNSISFAALIRSLLCAVTDIAERSDRIRKEMKWH